MARRRRWQSEQRRREQRRPSHQQRRRSCRRSYRRRCQCCHQCLRLRRRPRRCCRLTRQRCSVPASWQGTSCLEACRRCSRGHTEHRTGCRPMTKHRIGGCRPMTNSWPSWRRAQAAAAGMARARQVWTDGRTEGMPWREGLAQARLMRQGMWQATMRTSAPRAFLPSRRTMKITSLHIRSMSFHRRRRLRRRPRWRRREWGGCRRLTGMPPRP